MVIRRQPMSRSTPCRLGLLILLGGCAGAGGSGADLVAGTFLARHQWEEPAARWRLPDELDEVSGLTHVGASMLTHHDNDSTLWVLDLRPDAPPDVRRLPGQPVARKGDFEGLTTADGMLYLLGSQGTLLGARLNPTTLSLSGGFHEIATGVEGRCNFEGLAAGPDGYLYLACKYPREPLPGTILLFRVDPGGLAGPEALRVDVSKVQSESGFERLRPSGLAWLPETQRLLVLVGKERVILELDAGGSLLAWRRLSRRHHRQAEGLSVSPDGEVVIVDEADGRAATLSLYR